MNGQPAIPPLAMASPCVQLLENMMAEAKAGRITSIAVIAITQTAQVASGFAGGQRGELYVGAGILQRRLLAEIEGPPVKSSIIPARMSG